MAPFDRATFSTYASRGSIDFCSMSSYSFLTFKLVGSGIFVFFARFLGCVGMAIQVLLIAFCSFDRDFHGASVGILFIGIWFCFEGDFGEKR